MTVFKQFIQDEDAFDMAITGAAGTGKTTKLKGVVEYCLEHKIPTVVCAFTHKAKEILRDKLPQGADVRTLHSFLKKRPGINEHATKANGVLTTSQFGEPEEIRLLIVDEFSMVGEKDLMSIGELQDPELEGIPKMKVLYVGDLNQLPPVGDVCTMTPEACQYKEKLTKIWRQADTSPLLDTLASLVDMIEGGAPTPLSENRDFIRNVDIVTKFREGGIMLAYTNQRVQELNSQLNGVYGPTDMRWCPTTREELLWQYDIPPSAVSMLTNPFTAGEELMLGSKYKTLEYLIDIADEYNIQFGCFENEDDEVKYYAYIFGHGAYNRIMKDLKDMAARTNAQIVDQHDPNPKQWARDNWSHPLAKQRAKAWRDLLSLKDYVVCVDYPWAMTVHKSQGSTYPEVYIDWKDLRQLAETNWNMFLRLAYVAISRSSGKVYMNG